jgi:hypothetical protein
VHFRVDASRDVAMRISEWYAALPAGLFEQERLEEAS